LNQESASVRVPWRPVPEPDESQSRVRLAVQTDTTPRRVRRVVLGKEEPPSAAMIAIGRDRAADARDRPFVASRRNASDVQKKGERLIVDAVEINTGRSDYEGVSTDGRRADVAEPAQQPHVITRIRCDRHVSLHVGRERPGAPRVRAVRVGGRDTLVARDLQARQAEAERIGRPVSSERGRVRAIEVV